MTSVITGDIINSREANAPEQWLTPLKKIFKTIDPNDQLWEIYRGDSFQIEIKNTQETFLTAVLIKASIKEVPNIDVRMAIGVGSKTHTASKVSESNGSAFIHSGEEFEMLKQNKANLAIKTDDKALNEELNLYFKLALIAMDSWTKNSAEIVKLAIQNPNSSQQELGKLIGIKQNTASDRLKRAHFDEIVELHKMYQKKISAL
ncbi:SatD family protein [Joostella sp. CR20]|uniref:SatD family protein n=1 Tax=Joostella sp. CR20 TaxID=2804312 RepID=UPI00313EBD12